MCLSLTEVVHAQPVGADQTIDQRLDRHSAKANLGIGNHHACLYIVSGHNRHLQLVVHDLESKAGFRHLAGNDLHFFLPGKQRKHSCRHLQVVNPAITIRKERSGNSAAAIIHAADHVGLVSVGKPGIHVFCQQVWLLQAHQVVILRRNIQRRAHLTMEEIGRTENLLHPRILMGDAKRLSILRQME